MEEDGSALRIRLPTLETCPDGICKASVLYPGAQPSLARSPALGFFVHSFKMVPRQLHTASARATSKTFVVLRGGDT